MSEFVSLLPPAMSLLDAVLLVTASLVTSFISAAFGIGGGFTLIALLALLLPPAALVPIHGIVQFGSNAGRVCIMLKDVVWRPVLPFVIGTVIGAGLGAIGTKTSTNHRSDHKWQDLSLIHISEPTRPY